jgi:hypothetical protein
MDGLSGDFDQRFLQYWPEASVRVLVLVDGVGSLGPARAAIGSAGVSMTALKSMMMSLRGAILSGLVTIAVVLPGARVKAECIVPPPPCIALERSSHVFIADAIEASSEFKVVEPRGSALLPQRVRFRIVEAFKGVVKGQTQVDSNTDSAAIGESVLFRSGTRYVVYAAAGSNGVWATACSRTWAVDMTSSKQRELLNAEIIELRKCVAR